MTFKPSRHDHDCSLQILNLLTEAERAELDAHVITLNQTAGAWACNDPAPGSRKSFEKAYYAIGKTLRERGQGYPVL